MGSLGPHATFPRAWGEVDRSEARSGDGGSPLVESADETPRPDSLPASGEREMTRSMRGSIDAKCALNPYMTIYSHDP
jgi:hypothetical protein